MTGPEPGDAGAAERDRWRAARREMNQRRHALAAAAAGLYPGIPRIGSTGLLCRPEWLPARPARLDQVRLRWADHPPAPLAGGSGPASAHLRPASPSGPRYRTYAEALAALDPPALFENRPAYRPLAADLSDPAGACHLDLTAGRYFDTVSVGEALAHELAAAWPGGGAMPGLGSLPFRAWVGDPLDLARRPAGLAVSTLTLRRLPSGQASFLLHWRDPARVTHAGGLYQVLPVGIFQPADANPASVRSDLSLWRAMAREFSEELLGTTEDYTRLGTPIDYGRWDFYRRLTTARKDGRLRVWCLGLGTDPLTLATDLLAVAVFDATLFDAEFAGLVSVNAEGRIVTGHPATGFPFIAEVVARFAGGTEPVQAAAAAALQLAWKHRALLLG